MRVNGNEKEVKIPVWYGMKLHKGDTINVEIKTGLLGFDFLTEN